MVENQHTKITGYRDLTQAEIDMKNAIANTEAIVADVWEKARALAVANIVGSKTTTTRPDELHESMRQAALARTCFEQAFMHLSRCVLRPVSPWAKENPVLGPVPAPGGAGQIGAAQAGAQVGSSVRGTIPVSTIGEKPTPFGTRGVVGEGA